MITDELLTLIVRLEAPVSPDEEVHGWTTKSKAGIARYFRELKIGALKADYGLVRGLDAWGVSSRSLYDEALAVNRVLIDAGHSERSN